MRAKKHIGNTLICVKERDRVVAGGATYSLVLAADGWIWQAEAGLPPNLVDLVRTPNPNCGGPVGPVCCERSRRSPSIAWWWLSPSPSARRPRRPWSPGPHRV